jgi:hypothetical protein
MVWLATNNQAYLDFIFSQQQLITNNIAHTGWFTARIAKLLESKKDKRSRQFVAAFRIALANYKTQLDRQSSETPYGVPYRPSIWGAGWDIPGSNTASFTSGVGPRSANVAYRLNRADWSYIPGGEVSGTALIRPDFPEPLEFPFLWQQTKYVLRGPSSHYMLLVLAANNQQ